MDAAHKSLPIGKRTTMGGDGRVSIRGIVQCPRQGGAVGLAECLQCEHCERIVRGGEGDPSKLVCDHGGVRVEDLVAAAGPAVEATRADRIPVSALMSANFVCVRPDFSVEALTNLLLDRGFSGAPVVDDGGRPIGIVSTTDLVREQHVSGECREHEPPRRRSELGLEPGFRTTSIACATVADIMMPMVFALPENASVAKAAALMAYERVHRIPVVSSKGEVVGILTSLDILGWLAQHAGWLIGRGGEKAGV